MNLLIFTDAKKAPKVMKPPYRFNGKLIMQDGAAELIELLSFMCPGVDAQVTFRSKDHKELSGYWLWDIVNLQHKKTMRGDVRSMHRGRKFNEYHAIIFRRRWRWKDAMKLLHRYREQSHGN
jgi:hypothetical protein